MDFPTYASCSHLFPLQVFIVDSVITYTLSIGAVGMQVAFGRVRRKTAPTGG